jgi:hypothetical protein
MSANSAGGSVLWSMVLVCCLHAERVHPLEAIIHPPTGLSPFNLCAAFQEPASRYTVALLRSLVVQYQQLLQLPTESWQRMPLQVLKQAFIPMAHSGYHPSDTELRGTHDSDRHSQMQQRSAQM